MVSMHDVAMTNREMQHHAMGLAAQETHHASRWRLSLPANSHRTMVSGIAAVNAIAGYLGVMAKRFCRKVAPERIDSKKISDRCTALV